MKMRVMVSALVCAVALAGFGAVGERPGVLTGTPEAPLLVSAIGKKGGRVYLLGTDGRIVWEQTGCGNIHRAFLSNGRLFYANGCLWRVDEPGKGKATLLYDPAPGAHRERSKTGEGVYGFDLLENGNLLVAENATDFLSEITQDGKVVRRFKGNAAWLDGKTPKDVHHHYRMCRATAFGTWLVCCSGAGLVREFNPRTKAQVGQWKIGELAFDAYRKANGNTVVSHLSAISEFSPAGRVVRRFACADHPDLKLGNLCGVQDRPNGNLVVGSYRNGSQDGTRTTAFELTPDGKVVWRFASTNDVTMMTVWMVDEARAGADVRAAREQMRVFNAAAAKRFLVDMKGNAKYDYAKYAPAIEALIEKEQSVRVALGGSRSCATETGGARSCATEQGPDAQERVPPAEAVRMVEAYRQAMLANPVLDFDEILCVRRKVVEPRRATYPQQLLGDYDFGFTGLNAHNHMDLHRKGYENDIVLLSGWKTGAATARSLYRPSDTGIVRDLDLDFDASRILFTGYRGTNELLGVFEIEVKGESRKVKGESRKVKGDDGAADANPHLSPFTLHPSPPTLVSPEDGHYDIQWWDACYLPNKDQVVMLGTAPWQFLPCEDGNYPMCVLYRVDRKTGEVRQLTFEQDSDFTPTVTHDGRVMFTRWEYSDLAHFFARELMTMNPDGVGQLALWGSGTYSPPFFSNARSVPGEPHLVSMFTGGHHCRSELGRFCLCDPTLARAYPFTFDPPDREWTPDLALPMRVMPKVYPKEKTGLVHEFPGYGKDVDGDVCDPFVENQFARGKPYFGYPWPLSAKYHLVNAKTAPDGLVGIYLVDTFDNMTLVAEYPEGIYAEPIPFAARKRPPIIPDRSVKGKKTCSVHIADIYNGPGLAGVPRGTAKKLRVFSYHFNYHKTGGHSMTGLDRVESGWDIKRILGTVDIEKDGSVCFEMPANTPVSFQPLDGKGRALQLMRSWTVGMPGERVSCTGCHEDNRSSIHTKRTIADEKYFKGEIQQIKPTDGDGLRPWGFANELWPVVVKNCNSCHKLDSPEAAYRKLHPYMRRPGPESDIPVLDPLDYHASTSPLIQMFEKGHHGVKLSAADLLKFHEWGDLNVPFFGKWNPPGFQTDRYSMACTNQVARRIALTSRYANIADDPEAEHDRYATLVNKRLNSEMVKSRPSGALNADQNLMGAKRPFKGGEAADLKAEGRFNHLTIPGWPFTKRAAIDAQTGGVDDVPQVTVMTLPLGDGVSMTFRRIPAGVYVMGSTNGYPNEVPRVVTVAKAFWLGETEVRNDQYHAFDPAHDSRFQDMFGKDHIVPGWIGNHRLMPAVRVSWERAAAFCAWLGKKTGRAARLPTEEEWEWAARCGTDTPFPWGGLADDYSKYANLADKQVRWSMNEGWDGPGRIRPRKPYKVEQNFPLHDEQRTDDAFSLNYVRRALPNLWGLYDMHGNAAEWTASAYDATRKTVRGGSFASRPKDATSSWRWGYEPWQKVYDVGFRVLIEE